MFVDINRLIEVANLRGLRHRDAGQDVHLEAAALEYRAVAL